MRTIEELLGKRGATVTARVFGTDRWEKDQRFLKALRACDAILINGEGTLHHGRPRAERVLKVVDHPLRQGKPVYIVNALYQANPPEWSRYLDKVDLVLTRDSRSSQELNRVYSGEMHQALDLSMHVPHPIASQSTRERLAFGDSVDPKTTRLLLDAHRKTQGAVFLPVMRSLKSRRPSWPAPLRAWRDFYIEVHARLSGWRDGSIRFVADDHGFLRELENSTLHVTGRFHGVCLSLLAQTPVLTVASNSWKIEALLDDLGLSRERLITPQVLRELDLNQLRLDFSAQEKQRMSEALAVSRRTVESVFDRMAGVAIRANG
jgi:polysaccharide pyruvyl transferase WcaK-like protein